MIRPFCILLALLISGPSVAGDWPQFRGPLLGRPHVRGPGIPDRARACLVPRSGPRLFGSLRGGRQGGHTLLRR